MERRLHQQCHQHQPQSTVSTKVLELFASGSSWRSCGPPMRQKGGVVASGKTHSDNHPITTSQPDARRHARHHALRPALHPQPKAACPSAPASASSPSKAVQSGGGSSGGSGGGGSGRAQLSSGRASPSPSTSQALPTGPVVHGHGVLFPPSPPNGRRAACLRLCARRRHRAVGQQTRRHAGLKRAPANKGLLLSLPAALAVQRAELKKMKATAAAL